MFLKGVFGAVAALLLAAGAQASFYHRPAFSPRHQADVRFSDVRVYNQGNSATLVGRIEPQFTAVPVQGGLIHYTVVSPDGTVVDSGTTAFLPRMLYKHGMGRFEVPLASVPPEGSRVTLDYDRAG